MLKIVFSFLVSLLVLTSANAATEEYQLTHKDGHKIVAKLTGFDTRQAVVAPNGNFCANYNKVSAWHPFTTTLVFDGEDYYLDGDNTIGAAEPDNLGFVSRLFLETYTFKNKVDCNKAFEQAAWSASINYQGPILRKDLSSMKLTFVKGNPGAINFAVHLILYFDFNKQEVKAYKIVPLTHSTNPSDFYFHQLNSLNWEVVAEGKLEGGF